MLFAAIEGVTSIPTVRTAGDTWYDLRSIVVEFAFTFFEGQGAQALTALLADEPRHPELMSMYRQKVLWPRRQMLRSVIMRAKAKGKVRTGVDVSAAVDMIMGAIYCRVYTGIESEGYLVDSGMNNLWSETKIISPIQTL